MTLKETNICEWKVYEDGVIISEHNTYYSNLIMKELEFSYCPNCGKEIKFSKKYKTNSIIEICNELEDLYKDGPYISYAALFTRAFGEGRITMDILDKAREYYGSLWNYVCD